MRMKARNDWNSALPRPSLRPHCHRCWADQVNQVRCERFELLSRLSAPRETDAVVRIGWEVNVPHASNPVAPPNLCVWNERRKDPEIDPCALQAAKEPGERAGHTVDQGIEALREVGNLQRRSLLREERQRTKIVRKAPPPAMNPPDRSPVTDSASRTRSSVARNLGAVSVMG
jgi:hypothetical protein